MSTLKHLREDDPPKANPFDALVELNQIQERINLFELQNKGLFQNRVRFTHQIKIINTNLGFLKQRILKEKLKSGASCEKAKGAV